MKLGSCFRALDGGALGKGRTFSSVRFCLGGGGALLHKTEGSVCVLSREHDNLGSFSAMDSTEDDILQVTVNVDGLPLHKSTNVQFWPCTLAFDFIHL